MASLALDVERWLYLRRRGGKLEALACALDEHLASGDFASARRVLEASPAVAARVADAGCTTPLAQCANISKCVDATSAWAVGRR